MAKRQKRVKLSRAQILENESNKWQAKKSAAIDMLCKAMDKLKVLERRQGRVLKRVTITEPTLETTLPDDPRAYGLPAKHEAELAKYAKKSRKMRRKNEWLEDLEPSPDGKPQLKVDATITPVNADDRAKRLEAMGFRKTGKRKAQPAVTGQA